MEVEIRRMSNDVRKWPVSDKILKKGWIQVHSRMCEAEETGLNPLEPGHLGSQDQKRKVGRWIFQLPTVGAHSKGIHKLGLKGEGHPPSLLKWCEKIREVTDHSNKDSSSGSVSEVTVGGCWMWKRVRSGASILKVSQYTDSPSNCLCILSNWREEEKRRAPICFNIILKVQGNTFMFDWLQFNHQL